MDEIIGLHFCVLMRTLLLALTRTLCEQLVVFHVNIVVK